MKLYEYFISWKGGEKLKEYFIDWKKKGKVDWIFYHLKRVQFIMHPPKKCLHWKQHSQCNLEKFLTPIVNLSVIFNVYLRKRIRWCSITSTDSSYQYRVLLWIFVLKFLKWSDPTKFCMYIISEFTISMNSRKVVLTFCSSDVEIREREK